MLVTSSLALRFCDSMEKLSKEASTTSSACQVCGQKAGGHHFGIMACRACAAFFRRSVAEGKVYKCRSLHSCPVTMDQRNMCRCCRLRRCEELGMDRREVQLNRDPIGQRKNRWLRTQHLPQQRSSSTAATVDEEPQSHAMVYANASNSSQSCLPGTVCVPHSSSTTATADKCIDSLGVIRQGNSSGPPMPSLLQRMLAGYINFRSSQKSLHAAMYPESVFFIPPTTTTSAQSAEGYRLVKHSEYVKMERGCLSLQLSLLNDWHSPFDQLKHDTKLQVLRAFSGRFTHLDQCFHTTNVLPASDTKRFVMHYGQLIDADNLEHFFSEDTDPAESARRSQVIVNKCRRMVCKMRELAIREVEVAALAGVILWNEVALMNVENAHCLQSQIFRELHDDILHNYGINATGGRLGSILGLIRDLNVIEKEIRESVIIGRIFNPHLLEVWEDVS